MASTVEIVRKETIKPSSPTSPHSKNFKFSLLDQLMPCPYAPLVLFYPSGDGLDTVGKVNLLKSSLSKILTHFYMLAGKMKDDLSIDCNDEGAYFVEARLNISLNDFLCRPDLLQIHKFLPCEVVLKGPIEGTFVSNFQVTVFECGGLAIGLCISHKVLDGHALGTFLKAWCSSMASEAENLMVPDFSAYSLFPSDDDLWLRDSTNVMWGSLFKPGKCITKRFLFNASSIAKLKAQATLKSRITRVEAVSAFLWRCTITASKNRHGFHRPSLITHLVNLRRRIVSSSLYEKSIGNLLWIASAKCNSEHEPELYHLMNEVKGAISKVDYKLTDRLRGNERKSMVTESFKELTILDGTDYLSCTSWCKLGFYEADFGWGKPIWVSSYGIGGTMVMNFVILNDTSCGEGIEAWITLDEQDMSFLQQDPELVSLTSIDPSPLHLTEHP
ncbi:epi-neemfruitin B 7-O-acetyltransferse L7AT-like [Rutidosis leptorrhynchoides]|uniref:epi-neemfruitin B 7-O-acetyltransferse L7AT-like n=1 Tax=Rutidosis leptorrhynchoides TaxID=125765 RepID=UPI003A99FEF9